MVFTYETFGFGRGKNDSVRLFDNELLIDNTTWLSHLSPTQGLRPNIKGEEYINTPEPAPGSANKFTCISEIIVWPGEHATAVYNGEAMFLKIPLDLISVMDSCMRQTMERESSVFQIYKRIGS